MCRLFASLLKQHGPMDPNDGVIKQALQKCSTDAQVVICDAGGIAKFLRQSLQFAVVDGYVCLAGDAGKARQMARTRRQALSQNPQPQPKLNPPPYISSSANAIQPNSAPSTHCAAAATKMSAYRALAGMDIPSSSRVIPGLSQQPVSAWSAMAPFLSQPSASDGMLPSDLISSPVRQTAAHEASSYNDNEIKRVNGDSTTYDNWMTVSKVPKSSAGLRDTVTTATSGGIGELDDFMEPLEPENSSTADKLIVNEGKISAMTSTDDGKAYYNDFKNILESSGSSGSDDEASADESVGLSSSGESVSDQEDLQGDGSEMQMPDGQHPMADLDSFDTEVAEACSPQPRRVSSSSALSVTAPEFVPLAFAANQPASAAAARLDESSPKAAASSRASPHSRPSSRAPVSNKRVQTEDSWAGELQQLKDLHAAEVAALQQQLSYAGNRLQVSVTACDTARLLVPCFQAGYQTDRHLFSGLFSRTVWVSRHQRG